VNYDVIIVGNGMAGASLACALAPLNLRIAIVDKNLQGKMTARAEKLDGRKIALSFGSYKILQRFNVWQHLKNSSTAIKQVHVSQKNKFGAARIRATDVWAETLGYVVAAEKLNQALYATLVDHQNVNWFCPATLEAINLEKQPYITIKQRDKSRKLTAKLIVASDGVLSASRHLLDMAVTEKDYRQTALVTSVQLNHQHDNIAYQRFVDDGVLAMLPMQQQTYGIVYTGTHDHIAKIMQLDDTALLNKLQQQFGYRLGRFEKLGERSTYPIKMIIATEQTQPGFLLLGNAAHNISPIAAQGFNLALQDIYCLYHLIQNHHDNYDLILSEYQQQRNSEQQRVINFTDHLMSWSKTNINISMLKTAALMSIDLLPKIKQNVTQLGMGLTPQIQLLMRDSNAI